MTRVISISCLMTGAVYLEALRWPYSLPGTSSIFSSLPYRTFKNWISNQKIGRRSIVRSLNRQRPIQLQRVEILEDAAIIAAYKLLEARNLFSQCASIGVDARLLLLELFDVHLR